MATGHVKWFNRHKGFGFITRGDGDDIFVHASQIDDHGSATLAQGQKVRFKLVRGRNGMHAVKVERIARPRQFPPSRPRIDHR